MDDLNFISCISTNGEDNVAFRLFGRMKLYAYELNKLDEDYFLFENGLNFFYRMNFDSKIYHLTANNTNEDKLQILLNKKFTSSPENPVNVDILHSYTKISSERFYVPIVKFESIKSSDKLLLNTVALNFNILCFVRKEDKFSEIGKKFDEELLNSLLQFKRAFQYYNSLFNSVTELYSCHYVTKDYLVSVVLPDNKQNDSAIFKEIAARFKVPSSKLSRGQMLHPPKSVQMRLTCNELKLESPHKMLRSEFSGESIVRGRYTYYHYMQDGDNDKNWGCAYRSLQTIVSWYAWAGCDVPVPSLKEIQEILVKLGDKPDNFIGSRLWIGSFEINLVLQKLLGVENRIIPVNKGSEVQELYFEISDHFLSGGAPIMIGGGELAHTIIGVAKETGTDKVKFLVLDPHFISNSSKPAAATSPDNINEVISGKWVAWRDSKFWKDKLPYNLCLPGKIDQL